MDIIGSVKVASEGAKFIRNMFDGYVDGISKEKVSELQQEANQKVIDIQQALLEIQSQSLELQQENQRLRDELRKQTEIERRLEGYELRKTKGGAIVWVSTKEDGTYVCPTCVEKYDQKHMLQFMTETGYYHTCNNCESEYKITPQEKRTSRRPRAITTYNSGF